MCLLIFAHRTDPRYPLVLAANRDEYYARATAPAAFWADHPQLLAGRDLEQGGTWMGITRRGRFAAITNYRDPARTAPAPRSRGELPLGFLSGEEDAQSYLQGILANADHYAGFNLIVGTPGSLWYFSNSLPPRDRAARQLAPGLYGLSNAHLDTPWPKVKRGKERLAQLLAAGAPEHQALAEVVGDRTLVAPLERHEQGLDSNMELILSAQFITTPSYGTRSTTTLWVESDSSVHWCESSFNSGGEPLSRQEESFSLEDRESSAAHH